MSWYVENLIFALESNVPKAPENQFIFDRIQQVREHKDLTKPNPNKNWSPYEREKSSSKKKQPEDEKAIHWCTILAICNKSCISFPLFLNLVLIFAKGKKTSGFCDWLVVTVGIGNYRHGSLMEKKKKSKTC